MARVELSPGWEAKVLEAWDVFAGERLGPDIAGDARRHAPTGPSWGYDPKHPRVPPHQGGELKASIEHHLEAHTLIVHAHASYSAFVELGTRPHIISAQGPWPLWSPVTNRHFGHTVHHPGTRPQPFLRTALYRVRGE